MKIAKISNKFHPVALSLLGILIGLLITIPAVWADYEATSYGFEKRATERLPGMRCPAFIGNKESQVVSIHIVNASKRPISPIVKTMLSTPVLMDSRTEFIHLSPGEQIIVQRTVGPDNIDLSWFIFAKAQVIAAYPMADQENTCGIFVLPIAAHGSLVPILGIMLSALFMASGLFLLDRRATPPEQLRSLVFLVVVTSLAMLAGFMGWWLQAILLFAVIALAFLSLISSSSLVLRA
jgi:hypothetical protein